MRHSNPTLQPGFFFGGKFHGQLRCRPCLFGGKLHRELRLKKNHFEGDKIQSLLKNKSTNIESKERKIERDRENRRRRGEVRHVRVLANGRNMSDEQREKEQERNRENRAMPMFFLRVPHFFQKCVDCIGNVAR